MRLVRCDSSGAVLLPPVSAINRSLWRIVVVGVLFSTLAWTAASIASAAPGDSTSSRSARDDAVRAIPWPHLAPNDRRVTQSVIPIGAVLFIIAEALRLPRVLRDARGAGFLDAEALEAMAHGAPPATGARAASEDRERP